MMKKLASFGLVLAVYFFGSSFAFAETCEAKFPILEKLITLAGGQILVPADAPIGSVIYTARVRNTSDPNGSTALECRIENRRLLMEGYSQLTTSSNYLNNGIYSTNLAGIGIRILSNASDGDRSTPLRTDIQVLQRQYDLPSQTSSICAEYNSLCVLGTNLAYTIELIKTGPISGGTLQGSSLPTIHFRLRQSITPLTIVGNNEMAYVRFNGQLNFVTGTCSTPDSYTVNLGEHSVQEIRSSNNLSWVDSSITMKNCPVFSGYVHQPGIANFSRAPDAPVIYDYNNNIFEVTLTPITPVRAGIDGVFLTEESSTSGSGVDIQIHKGTPGSNTPIKLGEPYNYAIPLGAQGTVKIPLVARYIRSGNNIYPGEMNGKIVFTINYK